MRIVLTTTGGPYGRWIAEGLEARGVPIAAVLVDAHVPKLRVAVRKPRRAVGPLRRRLEAVPIGKFARLVTTGNINGRRGMRLLKAMKPDVLVLGGARIVSAEALAVPRLGTYNAHPARLPGFRGTGVVGWSIIEGVPVTITVHSVTARLDAGEVVEHRLVPINLDDTLEQIEARADRMCAEALADVVSQIYRGEDLVHEPQSSPSPIYRWLDADGRREAERLVANGVAFRLYEAARSQTASA
jgi:methionyl-tRNA formyltransferase